MTDFVPKHMTYGRLKSQPGWSERVIAHFLPTPDAIRANPHYRNAAPTKLYLLTKIAEVEARADWQQQAEITNRRKGAGQKGTESKRAKMLQYVESVNIKVPVMAFADLIELSCAHYNAHRAWKAYEADYEDNLWGAATPQSDRSFLARITTNYLRHQLTCYEKELKRIGGKVGVDDGYDRLKERVNEAIYNQYPQLRP